MGLLLGPKLEVPAEQQEGKIARHVKVYRSLALHPIPILPKEKRPAVPGWPDAKNGPHPFNEQNNVGLLTGVETPRGIFCVLDIDLPGTDPVTRALREAFVKEFENQIGPTLMVKTGGSHQGLHMWTFLDEAISKKMQLKLDLHHLASNSQFGSEIMCQGSQGGYNILCPPSTVFNPYEFVDDIVLENLGDHIRQIQKSKLLNFIKSQKLKQLFGLGELCSLLFKLYRDKTVDGELIDFGLAHFVLEILKLKDDELWHLAFQMSFGEQFDLSRTSYLLERTIGRLEARSEMIGMGSVVDKLDDDLQKKLLQAMEQLEIVCGVKTNQPVSLTSNSNTDIKISSSIFVEEDDSVVLSIQWLVPGIVPALKFIILHGPAGKGKTTAAVILADRIIAATGRPVIYVNLEGKLGDIGEKKNLLTVPKSLFRSIKTQNEFSILNREHMDDLLGVLQKINSQGEPAAMIIVDSLMAATGELNKSAVGSAAIAFNEFTSKLGCTVLLLHHNNKNDEAKGQRKMLGSATIPGAAVLTWEIQEIENCFYARKLVVSKSNLNAMPEGDEIIVGQYPNSAPVAFRSEDGKEADQASMTQVDLCRDILLEQLIDGQEKLADDVRAAFGDHDFKEPTVSRASRQLCVVKRRVGEQSYWSIPEDSLIFRLYKAGKSQ